MQIDARDDSGKTALLWAAAHGQAKIVELLLEQGTAVGEADSYGGTGLMKVSIAQCALLRCTQETAVSDSYLTFNSVPRCMWQAAVGDKVDVVKLLLAKGANVRRRAIL
jgi:ankyrin repeat protein